MSRISSLSMWLFAFLHMNRQQMGSGKKLICGC